MRVALLSFWHVHAADYTREALAHPEVELTHIWDEHPERGRLEAGARGVPFEPDLNTILSNSEIDGVIVTTSTDAHISVIPAAAKVGKHIFAEKVIAADSANARVIVEAVRKAGVTMMIALTRTTDPAVIAALELIRSGEIGTPTSARVRLAHDGALPTPDRADGWLPLRFFNRAESQGGAMIDLGAHPLYVTRLILGMPDAVSGAAGDMTGRNTDDNAAALFHYRSGAIGVAETGFVNRGRGFQFDIGGTEGGLSYDDSTRELLIHRRGSASRLHSLPDQGLTPFQQWVEAVHQGRSTEDNLNLGLDLTTLAEAWSTSVRERRQVDLSIRTNEGAIS